MKGMKTLWKLGLAAVVCALIISCQNEGEVKSTIVGTWYGSQADFRINPDGIIPAFTITEDTIPVQLDFKTDGSVYLTDNKGARTSGTYSLSGRNLTINIDYDFEFIGLGGTYHVEELTDSNLRIVITKDGEYTDPDSNQTVHGEVEATLYFKKQPD